jgi:hypothetical protein
MNSDMNNDTRSQTSARGPFTRWAVGLAVLVALGVLVLLTLAGRWAFRAYRELVTPPEPVTETAAPPSAPKTEDARANWSRASFTLKTADGLRQTSDNSWSVKGGRAFMQVRRQDGGSLEPPRSNKSSPRNSGRGCRGVSANDVNWCVAFTAKPSALGLNGPSAGGESVSDFASP